jgi:hypothetical protein
MPRWDNAPQAHRRVSNINFDIGKQIVEGGLNKYPMKDKNFAVLDIFFMGYS